MSGGEKPEGAAPAEGLPALSTTTRAWQLARRGLWPGAAPAGGASREAPTTAASSTPAQGRGRGERIRRMRLLARRGAGDGGRARSRDARRGTWLALRLSIGSGGGRGQGAKPAISGADRRARSFA